MDWDPTHSSLWTGQGLAWGPSSFSDPGSRPGVPAERKLNDFSAFDQSGLVKQLQGNLVGSQAQQQMAAQRQAASMGAAGSDANRAINQQIASSTQDRSRALQLQAAKEAWDSQMQQKQFAENLDMQKYKAQLDAWNADKAAYLADKSQRQDKLGIFGTFLGS